MEPWGAFSLEERDHVAHLGKGGLWQDTTAMQQGWRPWPHWPPQMGIMGEGLPASYVVPPQLRELVC